MNIPRENTFKTIVGSVVEERVTGAEKRIKEELKEEMEKNKKEVIGELSSMKDEIIHELKATREETTIKKSFGPRLRNAEEDIDQLRRLHPGMTHAVA